MNKFRRIAAFAAALCLGAAMFTGCGSSDDDVKEKDVEKAAAQLNDEKSGNSGSGEKQVKDIDPFENLKVEFKETSPAGKVDISGGHSKVKYKADPEKGLKKYCSVRSSRIWQAASRRRRRMLKVCERSVGAAIVPPALLAAVSRWQLESHGVRHYGRWVLVFLLS